MMTTKTYTLSDSDLDALFSDEDDITEDVSATNDSDLADLYKEIDEVNGETVDLSPEGHTALFVAHFNGMTDDLKEIHAGIAIQATKSLRSVFVDVTWATSNGKEPKAINILYSTDEDGFMNFNQGEMIEFRKKLMNGEYCKRNFDMGLSRYEGNQWLETANGMGEAMYACLGRNAHFIVDFLQGGEKYKEVDLTYNNQWGAW